MNDVLARAACDFEHEALRRQDITKDTENEIAIAQCCRSMLAGVVIPQQHLAKMKEAGERGMDVGFELAHQFLLDVFDRVDGVLLVPSFHRYEMVGELVRETVKLRDQARLQVPAAAAKGV